MVLGVRVVVEIGTESTIGGRVSAARERANMSPEMVADASGLALDRIRAVEAGEPLSTQELDALALALGVGVHGLLNDSDVRDVFGRLGEAAPSEVDAAVGVLTQFVRDYEFLCSLDA